MYPGHCFLCMQRPSLYLYLLFLSGKLLSHCVLLIYSAVIVPIQLSLWYKVTTLTFPASGRMR
jgi:hypothetical protein